jgi:glycerophosphoryl diester phosphodiesterase
VSPPALGWRLPRVFAHRCGGALAPENTLAGLRVAARLGVRAVEFDVMLSADGSPWLIHDETLQRTTDGAGAVSATRDADLRRRDAGVRHHPAFAGEPLPTLADAARLCRELDLLANIEIKPASGFDTATGDVVARCVRELWAGAPMPLLSSFSETALTAARAAAPELPLGCLFESPPTDWLARCRDLAAVSVHCDATQVNDDLLRRARAAALPVLCYTVNEPRWAAELFSRGVSAVFSDRVDCLGERLFA